MELISGVPADELKKVGLSDSDIAFIRERSADYAASLSQFSPSMVSTAIAMVKGAFETGIMIGLARAKGLTNLPKKIGF